MERTSPVLVGLCGAVSFRCWRGHSHHNATCAGPSHSHSPVLFAPLSCCRRVYSYALQGNRNKIWVEAASLFPSSVIAAGHGGEPHPSVLRASAVWFGPWPDAQASRVCMHVCLLLCVPWHRSSLCMVLNPSPLAHPVWLPPACVCRQGVRRRPSRLGPEALPAGKRRNARVRGRC